MSLLPRELPEVAGFAFFGGSIPAQVVGGDFYDFIPFEDGRLGHRHRRRLGQVGARLAPDGRLQGDRLLPGADDAEPGPLFQESNRRIYAIKRRMFVSLGYFLLDPDAMSLRYAIGGQPLPILVRPGDGGPRLLEPPEHRLPLGAFREVAVRHPASSS